MNGLALLRKFKVPQNAWTAETIRFPAHFKELRLSWTANALPSQGMEKFVDEHLPIIRENNPQIKYRLDRTFVDCDPFIFCLFNWERKRKYRCTWFHESKILALVQEMSIGGDFIKGKNRRVAVRLPRGQELWDLESKGHDVYAVYSKWKGDPPGPTDIKSKQHPHYIDRPVIRGSKKRKFQFQD
ncbi:putative 19.4 kDa protein T09A5.5 in chromosome III [Ditylenchus destructor]|nr:putative 19.4 kDa protein T09A5.5 in chromosome III [Ditylenchus destructor]